MDMINVEEKFATWRKIKYWFPYKELESVPKWRTVVLTCMDCRIVSEIFGITDPGELTIIRNAGALLTSDSLRSLLITLYELNIINIIVCGHTDCGGQMTLQDMENFVKNISERTNIRYEEVLDEIGSGDISKAILGFVDVEKQVINTVYLIKNHSLISPLEIQVSGYVYNTKSGEIKKIC